jgi:D-alanine--D-alanine ligase
MAKVGLAYDLINLSGINGSPLDTLAELDTHETVMAISTAIQSAGHEVIPLEADENIVEKLRAGRPDLVFNLVEGRHGDCRESHVPAMCEYFNIPYTGSGVLTLSMCLNKAMTNQYLLSQGVLVPPFQVFETPDDTLRLQDEFPLIVKLLHEGSSMGLSRKSVVDDETTMREQVAFLIHTYHQPALVQKYIIGREFTVGVLGNRDPYTLPITEIRFADPYDIVTYCPDDEVFPLIEQRFGLEYVQDLKCKIIPKRSICPAEIDPELAEKINQTAIKAFNVMGCRDWCRVDMRMSADGNVYVLELNPIAGIAPGYWLPNSAEVAHLSYSAFINTILDIAWARIHAEQPDPCLPVCEGVEGEAAFVVL